MFKQLTIAAAAICLAACATSGPEATLTADNAAPASATTTDPDMVICREETPTGSRFKKNVCLSGPEYAERAKRDREALRGVRMDRGGVANDVMGLGSN